MTERFIARYRAHLEEASRDFEGHPIRPIFEYRYAWLHGLHVMAVELGIDLRLLGESPNEWRKRMQPLIADE